MALADRLTQGTEPVTVEQRFEVSRQKCDDSAALAAWQARYDETMRLYQKYHPRPSEEEKP